jgi:dsRNA-specific ribonuclease
MQPLFSFTEENNGLIAATVALPNCIGSCIRTYKSQQFWRTENGASKDAAFHCYVALRSIGLINDHLLPYFQIGQDKSKQLEDLPTEIELDEQLRPWTWIAKAWSAPNLHQTTMSVKMGMEDAADQLAMVLVTPVPIPNIPALVLRANTSDELSVVFEKTVPYEPVGSSSVMSLRKYTALLHAFGQSDRTVHNPASNSTNELDFVYVFGPKPSEFQPETWQIDTDDQKNKAKLLYADNALNNYADKLRTDELSQILHNLAIDIPDKGYDTLSVRSNNLAEQHDVSAHDARSEEDTGNTTDCSVDVQERTLVPNATLIPDVVQHIEAYILANELQTNILMDVKFRNRQHIVTAMTAPSANWTTNFQRYAFLGDSILKFAISEQLFVKNSNWPEGYLSQYRDNLISNDSLARAAFTKKLYLYIITEAPKIKNWSHPRISNVHKPDQKRKMSKSVLADVVQALFGAAYLDSNLAAAKACMRIFIPEIQVGKLVIDRYMGGENLNKEMLEVQSLVGYQFQNATLLLEAMTHPSCNTATATESYQRLGFLGDAILQMLIVKCIFQGKSALPGQMTHMKAALTNANFLGFLCLAHGEYRDTTTIEAYDHGKFTEVKDKKKVCLWMFMRHESQGIVEAQKACNERFARYHCEIQNYLDHGMRYPWVQLAKLYPEKFFSDLCQSIIGAIYVDSGGNLADCSRFMERLGMFSYAHRMANATFDVVHPRDTLQRMAGSTPVEFAFERDEEFYRCTVCIDRAQIVQIDGCKSKDEATVIGADAAIQSLFAKKEPCKVDITPKN